MVQATLSFTGLVRLSLMKKLDELMNSLHYSSGVGATQWSNFLCSCKALIGQGTLGNFVGFTDVADYGPHWVRSIST